MLFHLKRKDNGDTQTVEAIKKGQEWYALCPWHNDTKHSVAISESKRCFFCHGCNVSGSIYYPENEKKWKRRWGSSSKKENIKAAYDYVDKEGTLIFQVVRLKGKDKRFYQRHPDPTNPEKWINNVEGIHPVLYNLPEVIKAKSVFIVEGEKDCENLRKIGLVATTNPMGVRKWKPSYNPPFKNKIVFIIPDNDSEGKEHAKIVAENLLPFARSVKIVELMGLSKKGDVSDWLNNGGTKDELLKLAESASLYEKNTSPKTREKGDKKDEVVAIAEYLMQKFYFKTTRDNGSIYVYKDGVYVPDLAKSLIKEVAKEELGVDFTSHSINEILKYISYSTYIDRDSLNSNKDVLNLENGLLNIRTHQFVEHSPEFLSTIRIPLIYNLQAECPRIERFLKEVLRPEDIPTIIELAGYLLLPDYPIQRAFLFVGDGRNGKTALTGLFIKFVGEKNSVAVSLQRLEDRFAPADLFGKLLNAYPDLSSEFLKSTATFRSLTGKDYVRGEKKFKNSFTFKNFAKLVFSANKVPQTSDTSDAFFRRWVIIPFLNNFDEDIANPKVLDEFTQDELSGLLNLALEGLRRLLANGRFATSENIEKTKDMFLQLSDIVYGFVKECCELDTESYETKEAVYDIFKNYCSCRNVFPLAEKKFVENFKKNYPVGDYRPMVDGKRKNCWRGIRITASIQAMSTVSTLSGVFPTLTYSNRTRQLFNKVDKEVIEKVKVVGTPDSPDIPDTDLEEIII